MANSQPTTTTAATSRDHVGRDEEVSAEERESSEREHQPGNRPVRKRKGTTRSREGCLVCRKRRVKCDETKPRCNNCARHNTDQECIWPDLSRRSAIVAIAPADPLRPALNGSISRKDSWAARSLSYFQYKSAAEFAGYFDEQFWSVNILQMAHAEPVVNQMLIALGARHEAFRSDGPVEDPEAIMLCRRADHEYVKAITMFRDHVEEHKYTRLHITLTCSALCIAFDWLRGVDAEANVHLTQGLNTLSEWMSGEVSVHGGTALDSPEGHFIRKYLKPIFITMALQTRTMPNPPKIPLTLVCAEDGNFTSFETVTDARDALVFLLAYLFPWVLSYYTTNAKVNPSLQHDVHSQLLKWERCIEDLVRRNPDMDSDPRLAILKLWHISAKLLFFGENAQSERMYDAFIDCFEAQVVLVEWLNERSDIPQCRFSVDMGAVPALYYTAVKCRNPGIRRRAIELMKRWPRREAVYDSLACAALAEEIMKIEEGLEQGNVVATEADVPGHARVKGKIWSECFRDDMGQRVNQLWVKREGDEDYSEFRIVKW
ncbi:hypothetical protein CkaCkLH20_04465 [Colletotrichum karsti]|uniref:Zn(2)-C6 fungal-type domain-containing protein n=1 Tax=Colletotrichum karsti TaxID=1095194 RepID=A0A9P6LJ16_9PEZI|nr:uncharacterized protein CkaCkLH20_04465 [Colletotrichum karsti]KAF9877889.1 hypothetical protein CkaCkLH20_04465 [Colletotrichum karsti]